jgi:hypothetical protein
VYKSTSISIHFSLENLAEQWYQRLKNCESSFSLFICPSYRLVTSRWQPLPDPDSTPPSLEPGLKALYTAIRTTVGEEVKIVEHVFPNPGTVVQIFLMRVFAQSVCLSSSRLSKLSRSTVDL